jgi:hypothetical protein
MLPGVAASPQATPGSKSPLGVHISISSLTIVLVLSTAVFIAWDGLLWRAPEGATHTGRIVASYLVVVPLVALVLLWRRGFGVVPMVTGVALVWGAKLVITSLLYTFLAPGAVVRYEPAPVAAPLARHPPPAPRSSGPDEVADVAGRVIRGGAPVRGAVVMLARPGDGSDAAASEHAWTLEELWGGGVRLVRIDDRILLINRGDTLHILRAARGSTVMWNVPAPPGAAAIPPRTEPGIYDVGCAIHPSERAVLVVVDHPWATLSDEAGKFELRDAPAGTTELLVVLGPGAMVRRPLTLEPHARLDLQIDATPTKGNE